MFIGRTLSWRTDFCRKRLVRTAGVDNVVYRAAIKLRFSQGTFFLKFRPAKIISITSLNKMSPNLTRIQRVRLLSQILNSYCY